MMPIKLKLTLLILGAFASANISAPLSAQSPPMREVLQAIFAQHLYAQLAVSPKGDAVAWQELTRPGGLADPEQRSALYLRRDRGLPVRLTAGVPGTSFHDASPAWSPDGSHIAFLSDAPDKRRQRIFVARADGSGARALAALNGTAQGLRWSPDGRWIAALYIANPHRQAGAIAPGARQVGVIGSTVDEQRIIVVSTFSGTIHTLTPSNAYVYEYCWSPDSRDLAYTYAYGSGDNNWWIARLAKTGIQGSVQDLYRPQPQVQISSPSWSPDGRHIAFIGGIMSDFIVIGGDVYIADAMTGKASDVTPHLPVSASVIRWVGSSQILMLAHDLGAQSLFDLSVDTGAARRLSLDDETLSSLDASPNGSHVAVVRTSFTRPAEIWAGTPSKLVQVTSGNAGQPRFWDKAVSLRWNSDQYRPQGWLIFPLHFRTGRRYPLITIVHGGPTADSYASSSNIFVDALTSHGYFVFEPNPRGSVGQGESFARANIKDLGYGDFRDDLNGLDAVLKTGYIDPHRIGMFGWSYGGYMGMWAETQTKRFKAIVAGAAIADWQSYYGQNNISGWMIPFFGASVYDDPAIYARSSPMTFIKQSDTPILMLQDELDEEAPAAQAVEFYHAMRTLGVPSQLVIYAGEGHGPQKPADVVDILTRYVDWFNRYLK